MSKIVKFLVSSIASNSIENLIFYIFKTYIFYITATIAPITTILWAYFNNIPSFYIWIGFWPSLYFVLGSLREINELLYRISAKGKIIFCKIEFVNSIKGDGITINFVINNLADFEIEFEVPKFFVKLGDKVPEIDHMAGKRFKIPPKGYGWHYCNTIKIDKIPESRIIEGYMDFEVIYGKAKVSKLKYLFSTKKQLVVALNADGSLKTGTYSDAV